MKTTELLREIGKLIEKYEELNQTEVKCVLKLALYHFDVIWDGEKFTQGATVEKL